MDGQAISDFLLTSSDGTRWDVSDAKTFDFRNFFQYMEDTSHLLLSKDELNWMDVDVDADRHVDTFVNMSCGTQLAPHLTLETVDVLKALGVDFVAASGRQWCCGKIYRSRERVQAGEKMSHASIDRFKDWGTSCVVHGCPSCQIVYSDYMTRNPEAGAGLTNKHFSWFLEECLDRLGDRVPWQKEVSARVLVENHGDELSPVHRAATDAAYRILQKVPGVEVIGMLKPPSLGMACATLRPGGPGLYNRISEEARKLLQAELYAQAEAAGGVDTIASTDKFCHREWCKFATERVGVRHYLSIVAEALGCAHPDRFQAMWKLGDPDAVFEQTRPYWSSWGLSEETGRRLAFRHFDPAHSAFVVECACGGDPAKCNTGRHTLAGEHGD
jgi:Fe-S oxidoreductase